MQISPPLLAITTFLASNEVVNHVKYLGRREGRGLGQGRGGNGARDGSRGKAVAGQGRAIAKGVISRCIDRFSYTCRHRIHYLEALHYKDSLLSVF